MLCGTCLQFEYVSFLLARIHLFRVYVHGAIWEWGWGLHLTLVYVNCAISVTDLV